jgi:hypothetical protein
MEELGFTGFVTCAERRFIGFVIGEKFFHSPDFPSVGMCSGLSRVQSHIGILGLSGCGLNLLLPHENTFLSLVKDSRRWSVISFRYPISDLSGCADLLPYTLSYPEIVTGLPQVVRITTGKLVKHGRRSIR